MATMTLTVNGEPRELKAGTDLAQLLQQMQLNADCVAVECNHLILERETFATTTLNDGDSLEVVQFVGGG